MVTFVICSKRESGLHKSMCSMQHPCPCKRQGFEVWCRTLAIAYRDIFMPFQSNAEGQQWGGEEYAQDRVEKELTLIAVVGIMDPIRPQVPASIQQCHRAGITVRMLTGQSTLHPNLGTPPLPHHKMFQDHPKTFLQLLSDIIIPFITSQHGLPLPDFVCGLYSTSAVSTCWPNALPHPCTLTQWKRTP